MGWSAPSRAMLSAVRAGSAPSAWRFARALRRPEVAQRASLTRIVALARGSGQAARIPGFDAIRTPEDFQDAVPLATADDYAPHVERQKQGARGVLTREPVLRFEVTGGSSGPSKYIPYTRGLLRELQRSLAPWLADMLARFPGARRGPGYWAVSPLGSEPSRAEGGIPVGVDDDAAYFPALLQPALRRLLAVPGSVARLPDVDSARYVTLRLLLEASDLALASVWNPSFLTLLFEAMDGWADRLAGDLEAGCCRVPAAAHDSARDLRIARVVGAMPFRALPGRASQLRALARRGRVSVAELWPGLSLVSTWTDAQAARSLPALRERLGDIPIQGKGLLSTEAVVSIPIGDAP
ncbi:MAG: GH3 auxin-responsive promoter family protein, partial [Pseudomonadota bacterium]